ncbi:MAG TPA: hypothetical protein VGK32_04190 [Vicinamibacterales bacterium]|jgi:hypothetical protein
MLTAATLGMAAYGVYSVGLGLVGFLGVFGLDWWADLALVVLGLLLLLSSALVRVRMPGGLALSIGAMFALQALSLHNDMHFYRAILIVPQVARGILAAILVALAFVGAVREGRAAATPTVEE